MSSGLYDLSQALTTLDRLITEAPPDQIPNIIAALNSRVGMAAAKAMIKVAGLDIAPSSGADDVLLTRKEAAERLGVAESWLARRRGQLPFEVSLGPRVPRYSSQRIERWLKSRKTFC